MKFKTALASACSLVLFGFATTATAQNLDARTESMFGELKGITEGIITSLPCPSSFRYEVRCDYANSRYTPVIYLFHTPQYKELTDNCVCKADNEYSLSFVNFRPLLGPSNFDDERSCWRSVTNQLALQQLLSDLQLTLSQDAQGNLVYYPIQVRHPVCSDNEGPEVPVAAPAISTNSNEIESSTLSVVTNPRTETFSTRVAGFR